MDWPQFSYRKLIKFYCYFSSQLREKVSALEKQLGEERQRCEDLQFRIDEATICGGNETVINSFIAIFFL